MKRGRSETRRKGATQAEVYARLSAKARRTIREIAELNGRKPEEVFDTMWRNCFGKGRQKRLRLTDEKAPRLREVWLNEDETIIRIRGKAYENLKRAATAMNRVPWCESDNTVDTVLENFFAYHQREELEDGRLVAEAITDLIETHEKERAKRQSRKDQLWEEFRKEFDIDPEVKAPREYD